MTPSNNDVILTKKRKKKTKRNKINEQIIKQNEVELQLSDWLL
jgi:hypothetical protein